MMRLLNWVSMFLLSALVAHLAHVLFSPRQAANAMMHQMQQRMGANSFAVLSGAALRRVVRHPLADAAYGACLVDVSGQPVHLRGPNLRTLWALTVYSPRGDVIYAVTDRHVPAGPLDVRFEYRQLDRGNGEIALPKLRGKTMVVPLDVKQALVLLEAWPWHPGQVPLLQARMKRLTCTTSSPDTRSTASLMKERRQTGASGKQAPNAPAHKATP